MALQLIDLGNEVEYIDINPDKIPYSFSIKLTDKTYVFTIKYNEHGGFYTADLYTTTGDVLAFGDPIRYGRALFNSIEDERFPLPVIMPYCLTGDGISEVTPDNFGASVRLYLHDRKVSA
jgi:hypothetical protein